MVKNQLKWEDSRKKLKERKKRRTKYGPTSDEPGEFGFPMGDFEEQIGRLLEPSNERHTSADKARLGRC
jgi:hypothetical protein